MNARDIVTARIAEQARQFPRLVIDPLDTQHLEARDAALAAAIDHAVMRRWLTLATVIDKQLAQPWDELEPKMQAILLVAAAQLMLLERLPDHAVINESVEWAKRDIRAKAGGMVNAVLRKVAGLRERIVAPDASAPAALPHSLPKLHERDVLPEVARRGLRCLAAATDLATDFASRHVAVALDGDDWQRCNDDGGAS